MEQCGRMAGTGLNDLRLGREKDTNWMTMMVGLPGDG